VAIQPGFATRSMRYVQLRLQSLCETRMREGANLYRSPISYTQNLVEMSWSRACPKVQFDESTVNKYSFSSHSRGSNLFSVTVINPDQYVLWPDADATNPLMNERLELVRLQYRPVSGGEWITAKDEASSESDKKFNLLCGSSRTEGCKFHWEINNKYDNLLSGFKDDVYEVRVKNFCFGGSSLADTSVHEYVSDQRLTMTVDTKEPWKLSTFSTDARVFGVEFDEPIDCVEESYRVYKWSETCNAEKGKYARTNILLQTKCTNAASFGRWVVRFPNSTNTGTYKVVLEGVRDLAGNPIPKTVFAASVGCPSSSSSLGTARHETRDAELSLKGVPVTAVIGGGLCASVVFVFMVAARSRRATTRVVPGESRSLLGAESSNTYGADGVA